MITKFRACWWALTYGIFFHIALNEHHNPVAALCIGVFYTAVVDSVTTGIVQSSQ